MKLNEYVDQLRKTEGDGALTRFARRCQISGVTLSRLLAGGPPRLTMTTALKIKDATDGVVSRVDDYVFPPQVRSPGRPRNPLCPKCSRPMKTIILGNNRGYMCIRCQIVHEQEIAT